MPKVLSVKRFLFVSLVVALAAVAPTASAETPLADLQPWMISAAHCASLGDPQSIQAAFTRYQNRYAAAHQLDTPAKWQTSYDAVVNEFVQQHGCGAAFRDGQLSFDFKIYLPTYWQDFIDVLPVQFK